MPAYVIAETKVTDLERYEQYKAASPTRLRLAAAVFSSEVANLLSLRATGSRPAGGARVCRPRGCEALVRVAGVSGDEEAA